MNADKHINRKDYQYTGNVLVNELPKPQNSFFQWRNEDITNDDLLDFEYRLLQKLYSMPNGNKVSSKRLSKLFNRSVRTINRTLEILIKKEYIHLSSDGQLIIRRTGKTSQPVPIRIEKSVYQRYVQPVDEQINGVTDVTKEVTPMSPISVTGVT